VHTPDPEKGTQAQEILAKFGSDAIRMHEIEKDLDDPPLAKLQPDLTLGDEPH